MTNFVIRSITHHVVVAMLLFMTFGAATAAGETPVVLHDALDEQEAHHLKGMLSQGREMVCCGYWQDTASGRLRGRVADTLGVSVRDLGDVHLSRSSMKVVSSTDALNAWGPVAVLYLDGNSSTDASLRAFNGSSSGLALQVRTRSLVVVPDGFQLDHAKPEQVAWLRVRRPGRPSRGLLEYYVLAVMKASFVSSHATSTELRWFGAFFSNPQYWHCFVWVFAGLVFTALTSLPLVWMMMQQSDRGAAAGDSTYGRSVASTSPSLLTSDTVLRLKQVDRDPQTWGSCHYALDALV
mmetsp:Transcript_70235/g.228359  ORF Transcript_70235/g.228359 Transcript_70235/m.228359 type:complete len:295 (+) Transcript_70235:26-910(+)